MTSRATGFDTYEEDFKTDGQGKLIVPVLANLRPPYAPNFVFVQIYQNGLWANFPLMWNNLASPAQVRGVYTYAVSSMSWQQEADEVLAATPPDCQIMALDIEKTGNALDKTFMADCSRVLNYWKANFKGKVIYYANSDMYMNYILPIMQNNYPSDTWYLDFPLWDASWPSFSLSRSPDNNPSIPKGMRADWKICQWTDNAGVPFEDQNVFNGQLSDLLTWVGAPVITPPPPVTPPAPSQVFPAKYSFVVNVDGTTTQIVRE